MKIPMITMTRLFIRKNVRETCLVMIWKNRYRASIHCRTRFSINSGLDGNGSYTVYGYCCYYNENGSGQATDTGFLGLMSIGYNNEWLGYGDAGYAGYRCVRDIE